MARKVYVCIDVYTVRPGDTLYTIARQYGIPVDLLMKANRIRNPYNLRIGSRLCIPGERPQQTPGANPDTGTAPDTNPTPDTDTNPNPGEANRPSCRTIHTVKAGDTLYMIAKMHRVTLEALMNANPDIDPYNMQIGTELCIPGTEA